MRNRTRLLAAALALALPASAAHAAGLARPNAADARALGWGGAFTAVADDASALHYNPAGMALQYKDSVMVEGDFVLAPRTYTPVTIDPNTMQEVRGADQSAQNKPIVLPQLGYVTRLSEGGIPSRLALGIGFWNTFGGQVSYDKGAANVSALNSTQTAVLELVPGVAYEVNDFLQVGIAARLGIGIFSVDATAKPVDSNFSALGVGGGFTVGIMVHPTKSLRLGVTYRSALTVNTKGSGTIATGGGPMDVSVNHTQEWPQQASIGAMWQAGERLRLAASFDWTDWSRLDKLVITFDEAPNATQIFPIDFHDSWAAHLGGEYTVSGKLQLRAGFTFDSNAVPDRTIERQYLDANKYGGAFGATYGVAKNWFLTGGLEVFAGAPPRKVPDNSKLYTDAGFPARANVAPGEHSGEVYTFELGLQFQY
jgi:long-chain fatty acid transport protein